MFTVKDGQKSGFRMQLSDIQKKIESKEADYSPETISAFPHDLKKGTRIILTDLKKNQHQTAAALRKRLARRFSILGGKHGFTLRINSNPVVISDRGYFSKLQFIWKYGSADDLPLMKKVETTEVRPGKIVIEGLDGQPAQDFEIRGWIGTVKESGDLKDDDDNLNKIVIMVRGKMAQEDILEDFNEGGMYTKYLMGEIQADFLDLNDREDIATSSRQKIIEDDPRYLALRSFVHQELKHIQNKWTLMRNQRGTEVALQIPTIKEWFGDLGPDAKRRASSLFGKINQLTIDKDDEKKRLFKYSVLAFEHLRFKENLDALERIRPEDIALIGELFADLDDIEASLYYEIIKGRLDTIDLLQKSVDENQLENMIRDFIAEKLWLLDPSWERAIASEFVESTVTKEFADCDFKLTKEESAGRMDIKYTSVAGTHVIIELKRPERVVKIGELQDQGDKYRRGLKKILAQHDRANEPIEVVFLIGKPLPGWEDKEQRVADADTLHSRNMRALLYRELLDSARRVYGEYLEKRKKTGRIRNILTDIEESDAPPLEEAV